MKKVKPKILIVDDAAINRSMLKKIFQDDYDVMECSGGNEAVAVMSDENNEFVTILLDIMMPDMDGFEVLQTMKERNLAPNVPVIFITGDTSLESELKGYEMGVVDVINKPFHPYVVKHRIGNVVELYYHKTNLETLVKSQTKKIENQSKKLEKQKNQLIETLSTVVEFRSLESTQHVLRIQHFSKVLLEALAKNYPEYKITKKRIESITTASTLHDVGKITVPDEILLKPGKLTKDEFDIVKSHTTKGCEIIDRIAFIDDKMLYRDCYDICRCHHEKYDGRGYPDALVGDAIPISAQVVSLADIYDTLISERVYKTAYSCETAYDMIMAGDCGVFNPKLLHCFSMVKQKFEKIANKFN